MNKSKNNSMWTYGITTVPERRETYLPKTLESLKGAGFKDSILFVDPDTGNTPFQKIVSEYKEDENTSEYETVFRSQRMGPFAHWYLSMMELYLREPKKRFYALFEDDALFPKNLREYIERSARVFEGKGVYLNCYCHRQAKVLAEKRIAETNGQEGHGWQDSNPPGRPSNPLGRGALALVFPQEELERLLTSKQMIGYPKNGRKGWKCTDGIVFTSMANCKPEGIREYFHYPGLCYHIGEESAIGLTQRHPPQPETASFVGESYDCNWLMDGKPEGEQLEHIETCQPTTKS